MRPFLRRSSNTTSPHSTIWLPHAKKPEKVKKFSLCLRSGNINPLIQVFGQTLEITLTQFSTIYLSQVQDGGDELRSQRSEGKSGWQTGGEVGRGAVCAIHGRGGGGQAVPKNCGLPNSTIIKEFKV